MPEDYILAVDAAEDIEARLYLTRTTGWTAAAPLWSSVACDRFPEDEKRRQAAALQSGVIEAYFDSPEDRDAAMAALADLNPRPINRERVDWLAHYQQSLTAMEIGRRFLVAPDASLLNDESKLTIIVPQEQAFGTGSHETTALCIETLEGLQLHGKRGLDVGSGSGILALAMLRLGAQKVIAFDNDPDAYGALRDNRIRNGIDDAAMPLFIGSVEALRGGAFDVITMNIIPEVIVPLLDDVIARLAGSLILSGILVAKRDDVVAAAESRSLMLVDERAKGEWWAGTFTRSV